MSTLLIHTKLSVPPVRRTQVSRPQLIEQLATVQEPGTKLALVAAPPGFGKTSLLAEWAMQHPGQVAWLSLDEGDNDNVRFWDYVIAALQKVHANLGDGVLVLLHEPNPLPMPALLSILINEVAALPAPLTLVLDDYHAIHAEAIHQGITFLLDHMPPQMRLVIATRTEPPLPLARLRVRGELVELRAGALRFSTEESASFLTQVPGLHLDETAITTLTQRTEGWAAGLQIAALALQGRTDANQFVQTFAGDHRFILDYLADEVLERQPADVQQFLLQSSILVRLNASLCEWVTGQPHARARLEMLDRANLFVVALDEKREWYRYHQIFTDFLRHRLHQQRPERVPELHRRASAWFEQQGLLVEAVSHALAAQDYDQAANLIEHAAELLLWRRPELHTLQGWLAALPEEILMARPRLNLYYAWVFVLTNRMSSAQQRLQQAEKTLTTEPPADAPLVLGMLSAIRSSLTGLRRQFDEATRSARQALELLPEETISWRCMAAINLGIAEAAMGSVADATEMLTYAMELSQEIGSSFAMLAAFWHLASMQISQLHLNAAGQTCSHLLFLLQDADLSRFPVDGHIALLRGEIALERNELDLAEQYLQESTEQINREGFPMGLLRAYVALTRVRHVQNDSQGAEQYLAVANAFVVSHHLQARSSPLVLYNARMWLDQGNLSALSQWVTEQGITVDDELIPYREPAYLHLARYLLLNARSVPDEESLTDAVTLLSRMVQHAESSGRTGSLIRASALYALALAECDRQQEALEVLAKALALAEPERSVRVFADEGFVMAKLLSQLLEAHGQGRLPASLSISVPYVRTLLAALDYRTDAAVYQPANTALPEPLSERELEVLRLMGDDLSSNEIAERLIIAVDTARKHVKNIYGKLAVHSRAEAIRRSRELGLL